MQDQTVIQVTRTFALKRTNLDCYHVDVTVDFFSTPSDSAVMSNTLSIVPTVNTDRLHFTPMFILPADRNYYLSNLEFELKKFEGKIQLAQRQASMRDLLMVEPGSSFCQVCRKAYSEFVSHIASKEHLRQSNRSRGTLLIREACSKFKRILKQTGQAKSKKEPKKRKASKKEQKQKKSGEDKLNSHDSKLNQSTIVIDN